MTSPEVARRIVKDLLPSQPRLGVVVSSSAGPPPSATVRLIDGGDTVSPLIVGGATLGSAGAKCLLVPTAGDGWVYVSTIANPKAPVEYLTTTATVKANWKKTYDVEDALWTFQVLSEAGVATPASVGEIWQGRISAQSGDGGVTPSGMADAATILWHNAAATLTTLAGLSATVHQATFTLTRQATDGGPEFVSPVMYGHNYTLSSPPAGASTPPTWHASYGPVRLPQIGKGQTATFTVPATWVTALAAGTITGFGFWSSSVGDRLISWRTDSQTAQFGGNADLRFTYTLP